MAKLSSLGVELHAAYPATGVYARREGKTPGEQLSELEKLRENCKEAGKLLGLSPEHQYFGEFPDNAMDTKPLLDAIHWLCDIVKRVKPNVMFTHHRYCTNIDHRYCHEAAVVALRPSVSQHIPLICGEVPSSTGYLRPVQFEPNFFVEVTEEQVNAKIAAMKTYESEIREDPHPRSGPVLYSVAKVRGSESGFKFAEAFMMQGLYG